MAHTLPISTTATPQHAARAPEHPPPTLAEILGQVIDLSAGFGVAVLPLLVLSVPAIVLFVALPAILVLAVTVPLALIGAALAGPPYLLVRWARRRRQARFLPPR